MDSFDYKVIAVHAFLVVLGICFLVLFNASWSIIVGVGLIGGGVVGGIHYSIAMTNYYRDLKQRKEGE